jgi:hypothetical protein
MLATSLSFLICSIRSGVGRLDDRGWRLSRKTVYDDVTKRYPAATVIVPPHLSAVSSETAVTRRDKHLETFARSGRIGGVPNIPGEASLKPRCADSRLSLAGDFVPELYQSKDRVKGPSLR